MIGTVTRFGEVKGYGFIAPVDGSGDVFVHYSEIVGNGYRTLAEGEVVEFDVEEDPRRPGYPHAIHVRRSLQAAKEAAQ